MKTQIFTICLIGLTSLFWSISYVAAQQKSIAQTAIEARSLNTLVAAAKAAGLVGALSGGQELTVFAPTDDAFAKLPVGTVDTLLLPENKDKLAAVWIRCAHHFFDFRYANSCWPIDRRYESCMGLVGRHRQFEKSSQQHAHAALVGQG